MSCRMIYPKRLRSNSIQLPSISFEGWFKVTTDNSLAHRHLPRRYYSEPNGAAILLGRSSLPRATSKFNATNIDQCLPR